MSKWRIDEQYIVDGRRNVICQWGSYTSKRNANLICTAPQMAKELARLRRIVRLIAAEQEKK